MLNAYDNNVESKFVSVLAGPLRSVVGLSDDEISQLADYFRAQDGRVLYHQLCQIIHGEGETIISIQCNIESLPIRYDGATHPYAVDPYVVATFPHSVASSSYAVAAYVIALRATY
ncbi:Uncharacterized protein OBRU01_05275 [Operophtera brumata]|uniref:Uncharacterized protein n=1 Tax=Operophtera brumata TaxID=104452 RepID=A0A0L7LMF6_OPEBR|nr:Uncharacterized protein OBRU01_05275 [Operophtera brumata]